ncbi:MAG: hypothetical protein ACKORC_04015 [Acidimicrobiia bacterium]
MSRRLDVELTSVRADGSFTWKAAGALLPKGVVDAAVIGDGAKVGDTLRVEVETGVDGATVLGVVAGRVRRDAPVLLQLATSEFQPVTETRAPRAASRERKGRDGRRGPDRERRPRGEAGERRPRRAFAPPPPELPKRPSARRLRPARAHRDAALAALSAEQRPVAERALQGGIRAVREAVKAQNASLVKDGKPTIKADGVVAMAQDLLPRLRVAEWLDRAEAAKADLDRVDLRDLRAVVAASDDPMIVRDETTRALAAEMRGALATRQETELQHWYEDIRAATAVGRVARALQLAGEPPKAGLRFPADLADALAAAARAALAPDVDPARWIILLEALAFSPVRPAVSVAAPPARVTDELRATVTRLAALLPQVASVFGIVADPAAPLPRPLRQPRRGPKGAKRPSARGRSAAPAVPGTTPEA